MSRRRVGIFIFVLVSGLTTPVLARGTVASAATLDPSAGFVVSAYFGLEADKSTNGNVCLVALAQRCGYGRPGSAAAAFDYPGSVAVNERTGDIYVADIANHRVQELTAAGEFVLMFGWDVNETEDRRAGATPEQRGVCTAASDDVCTSGAPGVGAGRLSSPVSVAVDQRSGDVYVAEIGFGNYRIDKYTANGRFVWTIGKHVDAVDHANICLSTRPRSWASRCERGALEPSAGVEPRAFKLAPQYGNLLAVGGPRDLLYVGDEHRVQEIDTAGAWKGEISLASLSSAPASNVTALALDRHGDLDLVYASLSGVGLGMETEQTIRRFNPRGEAVGVFTVKPRLPGRIAHVDGIALGSSGRLAVIGVESDLGFHQRFGAIYDRFTGPPIGEFQPPEDNDGIALSSNLYVAATDDHEIVTYRPLRTTVVSVGPLSCDVAFGAVPADALACQTEFS